MWTGKTHAAAAVCQVPGLDGPRRPPSQAWQRVLAWLRGSQPESFLLLHGPLTPKSCFLRQHKFQQSEQAWELYSLVKPGLRTAPMSFVLRLLLLTGGHTASLHSLESRNGLHLLNRAVATSRYKGACNSDGGTRGQFLQCTTST